MRFAWPRIMGGASLLLAAIAVSGLTGYVLLLLVASRMSVTDNLHFNTFWSALFFVIVALSGVQQEIARATRVRRVDTKGLASAPVFAAASALAVVVAVVASAPFWIVSGFGGDGWSFVAPLALGTAGYVVVAVISGTLYGLEVWRTISLLIAADGVVRLVFVLLVLPFSQSTVVLAWAVSLPMVLTPLLFWGLIRGGAGGRSEIEVGYRQLSWNVSRTVVAAAATGVLVSGFPFILGFLSPGEPVDTLAPLVFSIMVVRAPLATVFMSMQSYLVVAFGARGRGATQFLAVVIAGTLALTSVLTVAGGLAGPFVLSWIKPDYVVNGWVLAGLVGTSGILAMLSVTGAFTLSRAQHGLFSAGWIGAAIVTVGTLIIVPGSVEARTLVALAVGPVIGIAVHVVGLATQSLRVR